MKTRLCEKKDLNFIDDYEEQQFDIPCCDNCCVAFETEEEFYKHLKNQEPIKIKD